ncbi:Crotonobetainyl-CoA:carnitine CoA-transferase CaiB [Tistlia consotensis]|uniref:Crotonobetainyl-CoA:carnitine CoA-transferase CaiB n=1 Tax=Tistlia consotensis USBA 355 TaxID=560819 RepID=A0A1Y6C3L4_9PROT|nr:CoA transferase [Tistlia consotensis]SMF35478.1 Crotonobetainyl-CoA:carnitine CoA-transferase CaiB [Tistlia consotensis USBA 355]SNR70771.1 Crotonobetainyl-CoA:carnitine CoA-transferase CaiB [Tistlia consotensis]
MTRPLPSARQAPRALTGTTLVEFVRPTAALVTAAAVSFAGRIAACVGGRVVRVAPPAGRDPLRRAGPLLPDGDSALHRFLTAGKEEVAALPAGPADLVTDDPELAAAWTRGTAVLLEAPGPEGAGSELTILAASGLLDVFGEPGRPPLPLPGHQAAYAAGTAAFDAVICGAFQRLAGRGPLHSRVPILEVALWLNWKHYLAAQLGQTAAGVGRAEDWATYRCRDGHVAIVFQDKDLAKLAELTGEAALTEPRFATRDARRGAIADFRALLAGWAAGQGRDEITAAARRLGIPIGPVLSVGELLDDRQMAARAFIELAQGSPAFGVPALPAVVRHAA